MTFSWQSCFTYLFCFFCFSFLALHYASIKTPGQFREIASYSSQLKPWYDASWKF
ncbi:MAG: hypothetical protein AB7I27_03995 [Bacteriovoracaceae bacterium]